MFLRTKRLLLRPAWSEDARELAAAIAHYSVVRMLARVPWPYTEADALRFIKREHDPHLPDLLITLPGAQGMIVGGIGLHDDCGEGGGAPHVGYWVTPAAWGCGIATEALHGLIDLAGLCGHKRLCAYHASDNPASGRVLHHAGFRLTGRSRSFASLGRGEQVTGPELVRDLVERDSADPAQSAMALA